MFLGLDLVTTAFPDAAPEARHDLAEAIRVSLRARPGTRFPELAAMTVDAGPHQWKQARHAVAEVRRLDRFVVPLAPALAAWVVMSAPVAGDTGRDGDQYAVGEALYALRGLRDTLAKSTDPSDPQLATFLDEVAQPRLLTLLSAPRRLWHRGLVAYLRGGHGDHQAVQDAVTRYLVATEGQPFPAKDEAWYRHTSREARALLAERGRPPGASVEPSSPQPMRIPPARQLDLARLFSGLLASASAENRAHGIAEWQEYGGSVTDLEPLLQDDAPLVREHGGRAFLVEVRALALVALQDRYRSGNESWPHGAVPVRRGLPIEHAATAAAVALGDRAPARRTLVEAQVEQELADRVRPRAEHHRACRDYLILLQLGEITYERQDVDPTDLRTPLQQEILRGQMISARPRPQLRFVDPHQRTVGYLYVRQGRFVLDLDESHDAQEISDRYLAALRTGALQRRLPVGTDPLEQLRQAAVRLGDLSCRVQPVPGDSTVSVRIESVRRWGTESEHGTIVFWLAGRRLSAELRLIFETDWADLRPGCTVEVELWLERWSHDGAPVLRATGSDPAPEGRLHGQDDELYAVDAPVSAVSNQAPGPGRELDLHLDVGLPHAVRVAGIFAEELNGIRVGDRVILRAVLWARPAS